MLKPRAGRTDARGGLRAHRAVLDLFRWKQTRDATNACEIRDPASAVLIYVELLQCGDLLSPMLCRGSHAQPLSWCRMALWVGVGLGRPAAGRRGWRPEDCDWRLSSHVVGKAVAGSCARVTCGYCRPAPQGRQDAWPAPGIAASEGAECAPPPFIAAAARLVVTLRPWMFSGAPPLPCLCRVLTPSQ